MFLGYALETKFIFSCSNWIDPEDNNMNLNYEFHYRKIGADTVPSPIYIYQGVSPQTKAMYIPNGMEEFGYDIEIYVVITDFRGASVVTIATAFVVAKSRIASKAANSIVLTNCYKRFAI